MSAGHDRLSQEEYRVAKSTLLKDLRKRFLRTCCRTRAYSSSRFIEWLVRNYPSRLYEAAAELGTEV